MSNRNIDKNQQKPVSVNQIESNKPNVPRTLNTLTGYIANSMNGGINKVIHYKQIMAGEKHLVYRLKCNFQMLTPLTPAYQKLNMTIRTYFVPNSRVWKNAEKFTAQKGGTLESKIESVPNLGGKRIPGITDLSETKITPLYNLACWRDSFISSYLPRMGKMKMWDPTKFTDKPVTLPFIDLPRINALKLRGRVAIYNDYERNKEYDEPLQEFDDDNVSETEWKSYLPTNNDLADRNLMMRARRPDSYYTDYRTEIQGFEQDAPNLESENILTKWSTFESKMAESRAQAENAQKNDWDIISEIRGSKKLTEGKVQLLSEKTFPLNYSAITQNAYNNNQEIREEFRVMGKQGAYSYTDIDIALYEGVEFIEEGYIHVIATVWADTVFTSGIDRLELNVDALEQYRPDLKDEKYDVLKKIETTTSFDNQQEANEAFEEVLGFKRKFNEYFKLANVISGDMDNQEIHDYQDDVDLDDWEAEESDQKIIIPNYTYQFFERSGEEYKLSTGGGTGSAFKKYWRDYTDLMINKNQAILNKIYYGSDNDPFIGGQNQIFFVGMAQVVADLPIDEAIKNNFTKWGEH